MKKLLLVIALVIITSPLVGQDQILKDFAEPRRSYGFMNPICLYPSTLRMINLSQDQQFYELVNDIEKILIFTLDSATTASRTHASWLKEYEEIGYEEYITILGKQEVRIIGKEDEYVGVMSAEDRSMAFYLRGEIPFGKIPTLMQTFQSSDVLPMIRERFK